MNPMKCTVCAHPKVKKINKSILSNQPITKIALRYNVGSMAVRNHSKKHLSRQLLKSDEMKQVTHSKNLFEEVQELISRTKDILTTAENNDQPTISLGVIRELRQTYEFLIKFSVYMEQAKKQDMEAEKDNAKFVVDIIKERLSGEELSLLNKLIKKMDGVDVGVIVEDTGYKSRYKSYGFDSEDEGDAEDDLTETKVADVTDVSVKTKKKKKKKSKMKRKKKQRIEDREDEGSGGMFEGATSVGVTASGRSIRDL